MLRAATSQRKRFKSIKYISFWVTTKASSVGNGFLSWSLDHQQKNPHKSMSWRWWLSLGEDISGATANPLLLGERRVLIDAEIKGGPGLKWLRTSFALSLPWSSPWDHVFLWAMWAPCWSCDCSNTGICRATREAVSCSLSGTGCPDPLSIICQKKRVFFFINTLQGGN